MKNIYDRVFMHLKSFFISMISLFTLFESCISDNSQTGIGLNQSDIKRNDSILDSKIVFDTYCNARFGFCIDFPQKILFIQPESENGDGTVFKDLKGRTVMTVFGARNETSEGEEISLSQQFDNDLEALKSVNGVVTYKHLSKRFFVVSGMMDGSIFYRKTISKKAAFASAIITYLPQDSLVYNPLISHIAASFK